MGEGINLMYEFVGMYRYVDMFVFVWLLVAKVFGDGIWVGMKLWC